MDFINDLAGGHKKTEQRDEQSSSPPQPEHHRGLLDRLSGAVDDLSGKSHHDAPPPPPPPAKEENIFAKIGDALKGEEHAPPPPPPPPQPEGFFDKISHAIHGQQEEPKKPETFSEKFEDKMNNTFGGGAVGEAKEGHLDKAIDFYQEHVLKQGEQHNESAIEQAKDKQIASVIRHGFESMTGKEFSSSHGRREE